MGGGGLVKCKAPRACLGARVREKPPDPEAGPRGFPGWPPPPVSYSWIHLKIILFLVTER